MALLVNAHLLLLLSTNIYSIITFSFKGHLMYKILMWGKCSVIILLISVSPFGNHFNNLPKQLFEKRPAFVLGSVFFLPCIQKAHKFAKLLHILKLHLPYLFSVIFSYFFLNSFACLSPFFQFQCPDALIQWTRNVLRLLA